MDEAEIYRWSELPCDHPMALIDRRRVVGQNAMVSHFTLHQGVHVPPHRHHNEQIALVVSGRMRFMIGEPGQEREVIVEGGGVLHLPPNVRHGAEAIETSIVMDVFSPPSERTGVDG